MDAWLDGRKGWLTAFVAGIVSATAFAPIGLWPLGPLAFVILLLGIERASGWKRAMILGWWFGLGQFLLGLNWIATAFTYQDAMPAGLGWVGVLLLSLYLAVYPALAALAARSIGRERPFALVAALAGSWAIGEMLRGFMFTGFAWNPMGVALVETPWRMASAWIGTYGLSALAVVLGGIVYLSIKREFLPAFLGVALAGVLLLLPPSKALPSPTVPMTVVQPNIDQADKWRPGFDAVAAERLLALSNAGRDEGPRLILWPEAAVVDPLTDERRFAAGATAYERSRAARALDEDDILITGGLAVQSPDGISVGGATNSVFVIEPGGKVSGRYDKAHLVPYGEYLPMRSILEPLGLSRLAPGAFDFSAGPGPRNLEVKGVGPVGMQVCYEIIFPGAVVDPGERPRFIFNPSNDAWFGRFGPPQHLAQARLRAAEEGLPLVRATPTGISAVIDADGRLLDSLGWREQGVIDANLPAMRAPTLFSRFGNLLSLALALILCGLGVALGRRPR